MLWKNTTPKNVSSYVAIFPSDNTVIPPLGSMELTKPSILA